MVAGDIVSSRTESRFDLSRVEGIGLCLDCEGGPAWKNLPRYGNQMSACDRTGPSSQRDGVRCRIRQRDVRVPTMTGGLLFQSV